MEPKGPGYVMNYRAVLPGLVIHLRASIFDAKKRTGLRRALAVITLALLMGILYAGLKPFHAPRNGVEWLRGANGIYFSGSATVLSLKTLEPSASGGTIEIWIDPRKFDDSGTIIALYNPAAPKFFMLSQEESDLEMRMQSTNAWRRTGVSRIDVPEAFAPGRTDLWTISFGADGAQIYRGGMLVKEWAGFGIPPDELSGELILGTLPIFNDDWVGAVHGLAVYKSAASQTKNS